MICICVPISQVGCLKRINRDSGIKTKRGAEKKQTGRSLEAWCALVRFLFLRTAQGRPLQRCGAVSWWQRQREVSRRLEEKNEHCALVENRTHTFAPVLHGRATTTAAINNRRTTPLDGRIVVVRFTFFGITILRECILPLIHLPACQWGRYIPWESLKFFEIISRLFERIGRNRPRMGWHPALPVHVLIYTFRIHVRVAIIPPLARSRNDEMTLA